MATQAWEMWSETGSIFRKKLSCTSAYKDVLQAFGDRADVVAEQVRRMVQDLRSLPTHESTSSAKGASGTRSTTASRSRRGTDSRPCGRTSRSSTTAGGKVSSQALEASIRMPLT